MLMGFARVGTDKGIIHAAQCVARLGIQNDPRITFPGQRSLEVPKILKCLMHVECTALMNYEALMCLTNLASLDDEHRRRIYKEKVFSKTKLCCFNFVLVHARYRKLHARRTLGTSPSSN